MQNGTRHGKPGGSSGKRQAAPAGQQTAEETDMTERAGITDQNPTVADMEARVARFRSLQPTDDYIDARLPDCDRTTWRILGHQPGAPLAAEGFHMNLVRCEPGKAAPLHNHLTQEVFIALTGTWSVFWGPEGERSLTLERWDTVSIPAGVSRVPERQRRAGLPARHGERAGPRHDRMAGQRPRRGHHCRDPPALIPAGA